MADVFLLAQSMTHSATDPVPMMSDASETVRFFHIEVPFMAHIGLSADQMTDGYCRTTLAPQSRLTNSRGDIHGGVIMSAMDFTMSAVARSHKPLKYGCMTIDMATQFYASSTTALTIEARCGKRGRSIAFCDAEARKADGTVVAVGRAVFKLVPLNEYVN